MQFLSTLLPVVAFTTTALSHGIISSPYPRAVGAASLAACGPNVQNNIIADNTSHVEGLPETAATDPAYHASECNLWLCRGLQFADVEPSNILQLSAGDKLEIGVWLRILHEGTANVSIVDTKSNSVVGSELLYWDRYADNALGASGIPKNNTAFEVEIPDLGGACEVAGDCVSLSFSIIQVRSRMF